MYLGEVTGTGVNLFALFDTFARESLLSSQGKVDWVDTKSEFILTLSESEQAIIGLALSLTAWHKQHRFCARCGQRTRCNHDGDSSRRCTVNTAATCKAPIFPQLMPAILVAVFDGHGHVILSQRRRKDPTLTILSGFVLHGESAEEAVVREVLEETGVAVNRSSLRYLGSQSWPYPHLLMLAYTAVVEQQQEREQEQPLGAEPTQKQGKSKVLPTLRVEEKELVRVCWVSKDDGRGALAKERHAKIRVPPVWTAAHRILRLWVDGQIDDYGGRIDSNKNTVLPTHPSHL